MTRLDATDAAARLAVETLDFTVYADSAVAGLVAAIAEGRSGLTADEIRKTLLEASERLFGRGAR